LMSGMAAPSSSPLRRPRTNDGQMLPPLTPVIKLKPPTRAPPSASPNTNLQLHRDRVREMVGSPLRGSSFLSESVPWSPAFNIDPEEAQYNLQEFSVEFDIFADASLGLLSVPGNGSPEKRSAKRPRLDRSKSANILADISNSHFNKSATSTPLLKFTPSLEPINFNSATRSLGIMESPSRLLGIESPSKIGASPFNLATFEIPTEEEFFGSEFLTEEVADFGGMDIMQGFQKIGSGPQTSRNAPKPTSRPNFGRSMTSRF
jgi:forkhead transcription factor HCM1